jgi:amino acid adenylation domain-containing protein
MVALLLAVLKAGAAYVPLDPKYPKERLAFMLEDSGVRLVVTTSAQSRALPKKAARLIYLDQEQSRIAQCSGENLPNENVANDPAYVIYTSGSTGKPKGVVAPHKGAVNRFTWMWKKYPFDQDEVCVQKTSCNFIDSVWEIFGPLLRGIPTFILDDEVVKDPRRLVQDLAVHRVSRIVLVPSHLRFLLDEYEIAGPKLNRPKLWVASGEVLTAELAKRFQETMVGCTLLNLYGSSEVAADVTSYEISESTPINLHVPIGYPISNTQVYILDRYVQPVPIGVVGEICVAGDSLANEYLKRSELTATRFTVNPFSSDGRGRLFRTGDLGRWLPNGSIQYIGRSDFQVKIRGIRIELEEIEVQLMKHPDVKSAAVTAINSSAGGGRLVAYVTSDTARRANPDQLRDFLKRTLPDPMVPSQFIVLEALPLLPNGKVNRRALPVSEPTFGGRSQAVVLPRNEQEGKLAEIWEAILGISPVGVHQNFFDLGGHSLLAARMVASIEKILGKKLSLGDVFRASTVAEMSSMLNRGSSNQRFDGIIPIQPHGPKPPLFWVRGGALFLPLARRLSPEQPLLGLHLPSTEARRLSPRSTLEDIAGAFVRKMRGVQPEGPYCLAGLCVNGILAYEMARQLRAHGQQVALLAMFDSQNPVCRRDYSRDGLYQIVIQRVLFHLRKLAHLRHGGLGSYIQDRLNGVHRRWHGVRWQLAYNRGWNKGENLQDLDHIVHPAAAAYRPRPYAGNICFFQSTDWPSGQYWKWHLGWIPVAVGGLDVQTIEGEHESIFHEANVERLVTRLKRCLQESQNDAAQGSLGFLFDPEVSMATLENAPQC